MGFSGIRFPRRKVKSEQTTTRAPESAIRLDSACVPIPAYTTEWIAPMRAHASIVMIPSGTSGM